VVLRVTAESARDDVVRIAATPGTIRSPGSDLRPLPVAIFVVSPEYRGYSYIVLEDDTICIIDERTYLITDVIPSRSGRRSC